MNIVQTLKRPFAACILVLHFKKGICMENLLNRISADPNICFGKPCVKGTRIWVSLILDFMANGMSPKEILAEYPQLSEDDIKACLAYGAEMSRERFVEVS
jgi:uncharacterized protein (DUF433 family)